MTRESAASVGAAQMWSGAAGDSGGGVDVYDGRGAEERYRHGMPSPGLRAVVMEFAVLILMVGAVVGFAI